MKSLIIPGELRPNIDQKTMSTNMLRPTSDQDFFQAWLPASPKEEVRENLQVFFRRGLDDLMNEKTFRTAPRRTSSGKLRRILDMGGFDYDLTNMYVENYEARCGRIPMPTETTSHEILDACHRALDGRRGESDYLYNFGMSLSFFVFPLLSRRRSMAEPLSRLFGAWVESLRGISEDDWQMDYRLAGMSLAVHLKPGKKAAPLFREPFCRYIDLVPNPYENWCQRLFAIQCMASLGVRNIKNEIDAAIELALPYLDEADMLEEVFEKLQTYRDSI